MSDRTGSEGDYVGARHYRQGDSLRQVNWKLSARRNRLVVLERQSAAQQPIRIFLDLNPDVHQENGSQSSYEWVIRTASTICKQFHLNQSSIELNCVGMPLEIPSVSTNQKGLSHLLDFLALLPERVELVERMGERCAVRKMEDVLNVGAQDKVYIIGSGKSDYSAILNSFPHAVVFVFDPMNPNAKTIENPCDKNVIALSTQQPTGQLKAGWERLCSNA